MHLCCFSWRTPHEYNLTCYCTENIIFFCARVHLPWKRLNSMGHSIFINEYICACIYSSYTNVSLIFEYIFAMAEEPCSQTRVHFFPFQVYILFLNVSASTLLAAYCSFDLMKFFFHMMYSQIVPASFQLQTTLFSQFGAKMQRKQRNTILSFCPILLRTIFTSSRFLTSSLLKYSSCLERGKKGAKDSVISLANKRYKLIKCHNISPNI